MVEKCVNEVSCIVKVLFCSFLEKLFASNLSQFLLRMRAFSMLQA